MNHVIIGIYRSESTLPFANEMNAVIAIDTMELQKMFTFNEGLTFSLAKWFIMSDDVATKTHLLPSQKILTESPNR